MQEVSPENSRSRAAGPDLIPSLLPFPPKRGPHSFFFFENAQDMAEESLETSFEAVPAPVELGPSQPKGKSRE